jgi:hypothetical protein
MMMCDGRLPLSFHSLLRFLFALSPVSVKWNPRRERLYVAYSYGSLATCEYVYTNFSTHFLICSTTIVIFASLGV